MITIKEIETKDVQTEIESKIVTDYFKQSAVQKDYRLIAVIPDDAETDTLIAVAEEKKWSPYSERSRYNFMYFRKGETSPWKFEVTPVADTSMTEKEAIDYLSANADETKDLKAEDFNSDPNFVSLYDAVMSKNLLLIEKWIDQASDRPYINMADVDLDSLKAALIKKEAA